MKPVIRYIGGKYNYGKVFEEMKIIPKNIETYVEPFVGGGGFLCYIEETRSPKSIIINDKDKMLINFYYHLKKTPQKFVIKRKISKKYFEECVEKLNNFKGTLEDAICYYIVKNCSYNSIISQNKNGFIRSCYSTNNSKYTNFKEENIIDFSNMMKKSKMFTKDYTKILPKNSFVFLDPPYILRYINTYYKEFYITLKELYSYFIRLHKNNNKILLTLNYNENIRKKFEKFNIKVYKKLARHKEGSKKGFIKELIITNY